MTTFDETLSEAAVLLTERPLRTSLTQSEKDRIAEFYFASRLADDDELTQEGDDDGRLMLYLGVRRGDAVRLGKQHVRNGAVHFVPNKTRHKKMDAIELPVLPGWRVSLPRAHAATRRS